MNRRTFLLILLLVLAVALLVVISRQAISPPQGTKTTTTELTPTPAARNFTTLVASPSAGLLTVGQEDGFVVIIDTDKNNIAAVQLEMIFNPGYLSVSKITPLDFFKDPTILLNEVDNKQGTISYALGTTEVRIGRGQLVKITVVGKKPTGPNSTPITFLPKTSVGEIGNPSSVLKEAVGANFLIR